MSNEHKKTVGACLFPGFELLDIYGPLEMLGSLSDRMEVVIVGETSAPIASAQGPSTIVDVTFDDVTGLDILLLPGGRGTRQEVDNERMIDFLKSVYPQLEYLASICTGAGLLARAGLLDGRRATTNKKSFQWVVEQGPNVSWVPEARWVEDGNILTSGGVAAGIDMALALVAKLYGADVATKVAEYTEYEWHRNADWDPFAKLAGLV